MATSTSSAFTLQEQTGRDVVTLTSYAGPISWATTPVSGDQIEYPTTLTVANDGSITGPTGSYTVRHIIASTGAIQAVTHTRTAGTSASSSFDFTPSINGNIVYITLTSFAGQMTFPTTPVAGDQIAFSSGSVSESGVFSGPNATHALYHIISSTGVIEAIDYTHSGSNTAPSLPDITDVVSNVGDIELFKITASDPDVSDTLTYSANILPSGINLTGDSVQGVYFYEETIPVTFTVSDGTATDTAQVLFSIARAGYTITTSTVNYAGLNPDSPLIGAITDSDFVVGDQIDYPATATDAVGNTRTIGFASDGLMSVSGTRSVKVDGVYIRDASNSYARVGPFSVTFKNTGPTLTSALEVVPNSATTSGGQMRFTSDEGSEVVGANGDYRLIAIPSGFGTPTRAQVMAGQGPDGNAALFDSGLQQQAATVEEIVTVTGLPTAGAGYWIFLALEDQYGGITLSGPVTLTTISTGQPPVWSTVPDQTFSENANPNFDLGAYVSDFVSISLSWSPALSGSTGVTFNGSTGLLGGTVNTNDASGAPGVTTTHTVTATATNATGSSNVSFDVGFYRLNPPVAGSIPNQSWKEGQAVNAQVINLTTAITGATSYELQIDGSDATAELATYGITFNSSTGAITGQVENAMLAGSPYSMRARGINADGNSAWINFTVTVNPLTAAGFFGPIPNSTFDEGSSVNVNYGQYFTNAQSYSISGLPSGTGLTLNTSTGVLTGTANAIDSANSPMSLTITAVNTDGNASGPATLVINSANPPVLVAALPNVSFSAGDAVSIVVSDYFTGEDSTALAGLPVGSGLTFTNGVLSGTLNAADRSASPLVLTASATNGDGVSTDTFLIEVTGAILVDGTVDTPAIRTVVVPNKRKTSPRVFTQDTLDRLDYAVDLSTWLGSDTISNVVITDGESIIDAGIKSSTAFMAFVTGGTPNEATKVTGHVTTAYGREIDVSFYVAFVDY